MTDALEIELNPGTTPFNLDHTLSCGQVFRWKKVGDYWWGIVDETLVKVLQRGDRLFCEASSEEKREDFVREYFRLDDDLPYITSLINKDKTIGEALNRLHGLRITHQDPWECLISFVCATFSNVTRIKGMIRNLCQHFGRKINHNGFEFYGFPREEALAKASTSELVDCNLGYRAEYVKGISQSLVKGEFNLDDLRGMSYEEARESLQSLRGVGYKVADCVLLFSLEKLEAFPVDVWVRRILQNHYGHHFGAASFERRYLTPRMYRELNGFGRKYFGSYAGYAQEYLYAAFSTVVRRSKTANMGETLSTFFNEGQWK